MFSDAKNYMKRKIHKLDYVHTALPENYEATEAEYKKIRSDLDMLTAIIKSLSYYEYGGQYFKQFASLTNMVASKSRIKSLKREDIFTDAARIGVHFGESSEDKAFKKTSEKFSDAWLAVSDDKAALNAKLADIQATLSALKKEVKSIDARRSKLGKERYELEEAAQASEPVDTQKKSMYESEAKTAMSEMKEFMGDAGLSGIMKKIVSAYKEFSAASASHLSEFSK